MTRRDRIMERVLARVRHEPPPPHLEHLGPCWIWEGPTSGTQDGTRATRGGGYPRMCLDGQTVAVHRVTCTHEHGYLPSRRQVDHLCRRRLCVAPLHVEPVTHRVNQKRRDAAVGLTRECATEGCGRPGIHHFESGGVGSLHCTECAAELEAQRDRWSSGPRAAVVVGG